MNMFKKTIATLALLASLIVINGFYYVFLGQQNSIDKLNTGKELNLYECCSIFSMHTAIWILGWLVSPEAAEQAFLMNFPAKPRYRDNDFFLKSKLVYQTKLGTQKKLQYNKDDFTGKECRYALALDGAIYYNYPANQEVVVSAEYGNRTDSFKIGKLTIPIHYTLLKYIQDKGWIHKYTITYVDPTFSPV